MSEPDKPFKLAGLVLIVVGILDVCLMVYTVANDGEYSSSLNVFAIIFGILLMRGSARTARILRWACVFFFIVTVGSLLTVLAITPETLFMTQMKLDTVGTMSTFVQMIVLLALFAWLFYQLSTPSALQRLAEADFRNGPPFSAGLLGIVISGLMIYFMTAILGGESAGKARALARDQLGNGYAYHVTSINITNDTGSAIVTAFNENEIRNIQVSW